MDFESNFGILTGFHRQLHAELLQPSVTSMKVPLTIMWQVGILVSSSCSDQVPEARFWHVFRRPVQAEDGGFFMLCDGYLAHRCEPFAEVNAAMSSVGLESRCNLYNSLGARTWPT